MEGGGGERNERGGEGANEIHELTFSFERVCEKGQLPSVLSHMPLRNLIEQLCNDVMHMSSHLNQ